MIGVTTGGTVLKDHSYKKVENPWPNPIQVYLNDRMGEACTPCQNPCSHSLSLSTSIVASQFFELGWRRRFCFWFSGHWLSLVSAPRLGSVGLPSTCDYVSQSLKVVFSIAVHSIDSLCLGKADWHSLADPHPLAHTGILQCPPGNVVGNALE